jgi:large subunit ribosomal protein L10
MPTEEKVRRVAELAERIGSSAALLLTEYRGLTVSEIAELRRSLAEAQASFSVVKNTIMQRAASAAGMEELGSLLSGPSAVAFVDGDPVAAAKALSGIAKRYPALVLKGGWMDGRALDADEAKRLADLESREVMLSKFAGMVQGEIARAASMFQAAQSRFLSLLEAYRGQLPVEEGGEEAQVVVAATGEEAPDQEPDTEAVPDGTETIEEE